MGKLLRPMLARLLALVMVLGMIPTVAFAAEGDTGTTLYLKPNGIWQTDNARFAMYFYDSSTNKWVDMTDNDGDGIYKGTVPEGSWTNVIFCRMNGTSTVNGWDYKWNQTGDLGLPTNDNICYTITNENDGSGKSAGTWGTYTPGEPGTFIIAGTAELCGGSGWTPSDTTNKMEYDTEDELFKKVYQNVPAGDHAFKVTTGSWNPAWGGTGTDGNYEFTLDKDSKVTITFNATTKAINVIVGNEILTPDPTYYVTGDAQLFGAWAVTGDGIKMADGDGNGIWTRDYENVPAGVYRIKVTEGTWDKPSWGVVDSNYNTAQNYVFSVSQTCSVTVSFDPKTEAVSVSGTYIDSNTTPETSLTVSAMSVVCDGDAESGWLGGVQTREMTTTDGKVYEVTFNDVPAGTYTFKFAADGTLHEWGAGTGNAAVHNGENSFTVTVADDGMDNVTLKLDLTNYNHYEGSGATYTATLKDDSGTAAPVDYYLAGSINGADYGIVDDAANLGTYKFENGTLTVTFTSNSYVIVKDSDNTQYCAEKYATGTSVTLKSGWNEKLLVPGGVEVTFTLVDNGDGTLTLSYTTGTVEPPEIPEIPEGYNKVLIHFLRPANWGSGNVNAYLWHGSDSAVPGYEAYKTWPGKAIPANADKAGWYDIEVGTATPMAFNFIFNVNGDANKTGNLATGAVTKNTELWVVGETVYTEAPIEWTHYTATIHFQKPEAWGDTVNAYWWTGTGKPANPSVTTAERSGTNPGWYTSAIQVEIGESLGYYFGDDTDANKTGDLDAGVLTSNIELWVNSSGQVVTKPAGWIDENRTIHLPGTIGGNGWNAAGNKMTYDPDLGLYTITFENVTPGTYEYKIAVNGGWTENYGAGGVAGGDNMSVSVLEARDVTFWYNDNTKRVVCSVDYDLNAEVTLLGTGKDTDPELTDPNWTGIYSVKVPLTADTYNGLAVKYTGSDGSSVEVNFNEFTLSAAKDVTFYYDPATGLAYHDGSDVKVDPEHIYYNSKDQEYKDPFGAVAVGQEVTFSITTGVDATRVVLAVRGLGSIEMEKAGEPDTEGKQLWTCKTSFPIIGVYKYYFAVTNGSDMVFYRDDKTNPYYKTGDYGTGMVSTDAAIPYDLVVYKAGYETPDWMKDAVIYQIFPDRFFDGDESNNQAQDWARGAVDYEYITDWYTLPENPEQEGLLSEEEYKATGAHWGDGQWSNEIYGGDLKGITEKIDYLKALGVNVIYLNPVFWSISNHRYDAVSYDEIDPILGTLGDFEELVAVAEANGMHIILDGVFNHVSDDSIYFDRYYKFLPDAAGKYDGKIGAYPYWAYVYDYMDEHGASQEDAEAAAKTYFTDTYGITDWSYTEWFRVSSTPMTGVVDNIGLRAGKEVYSYEGWWGYDSMPVIYSTNGSEYQTGNWAQEIIDDGNADTKNSVTEYWISKGMDGWRLDVANEVSDETWQNFRDSVKATGSEAVIIGEIWADAIHYLMGDMYDSVMNYVFRDAVAGFARGYLINRDNKAEMWDDSLTADEAMTILEILRERYPSEAFYAMMNLVGSHDTSRILSYLDDVEDDRYQKDKANAFPTYEGTGAEAKQLQYVVSFLQFTYAGAPTIYYGDEIGMVGGDDPDDRRAFEWGKGNQELVEWYARLAAIRAAYPALRTGAVAPFSTGDDDVMGFVRTDDANTIVVLANRAAAPKTFSDIESVVSVSANMVDLITGNVFTGEIPAYRGVILVPESQYEEVTVNTEDLAAAHDEAYIVDVRDSGDDGPIINPPYNPPATPPATEAVTVPISGDENTIHVGASVIGDKATIDEVDLSHLDTVIGDDVATGVVTIDFSGLETSEPITTVELPAEVVKQIAAAVSDPANDAESLEIVLSDGSSIEFDAVALGEKAAQAEGLDITISILHVEDVEITDVQREAIGDRPAYDITVTSGGKHISDMGGKVTVHAPYVLREGEHPRGIVVYYVDEQGNREACETSYDSVRQRVNWKTDHLSLYMIDYDEELAANCPKDETCPMYPFTDVDINGWYHDGIHYCIEHGLMIGTGDTEFQPHGLTTRGTIVTILHRLEGEPQPTTTGTFSDVADGLWYTEAVEWAAANGIVEGDGESFYPEANLTREQMATILYRYAQHKGIDVTVGEDTNVLSFGDVGEVSEWAYPALQWACAVGLYQGDDNGLLRPGADLERCEMATLIYRLCENILK